MSNICRRCNRVLKNPVSIKKGIGAICARKEMLKRIIQNEADTDLIVPYDGGNIFIERLQPERATVSDIRTNVMRTIYRHSPTGFNFGYAGSGPSDWSLNICRMFAANLDDVDGIYQSFKFQFATRQPDETGRLEIPVAEIEKFFAEKGVTFKNPVIFAERNLFSGD